MTSGVLKISDLRRGGWDDKAIRAALDAGTLVRITRGWVAHPTAESAVVRAVSKGGRLGCLSGCAQYGLWTRPPGEPHVIVDRGAKRSHPNWHPHYGPLPAEAVFPLADCLAQVIRHHSAEDALMVLESAVNLGLTSLTDARVLIAGTSGRQQHALRFFDPSAESGSETRLRLWLQQHQVQVKPQIDIPGVGRVDFLVGKSLLLECDSRTHHQYRDEDYRRDMAARALGYAPVRLSYRQLFDDWTDTQEYLLRLLRTRRHHRPPRPY